MKYIIFSVLIFNSVLTFSQTRQELWDKASEMSNLGEFDAAIEYLSEIIKSNPKDSTAYFDRGLIKEYKNDIYGAINDFTKQLTVNSDCMDCYFFRGINKIKLKKNKSALSDLTFFLKLEPTNDDGYFYRGIAKYNLKIYQEAITDFTIAINSRKESKYFYNRGKAFEKINENKKALFDYDLAIELDSIDSKIYLRRSELKLKLNQIESGNLDIQISNKINKF